MSLSTNLQSPRTMTTTSHCRPPGAEWQGRRLGNATTEPKSKLCLRRYWVSPFFARTYLASLKGPCGCRMRCFAKLVRKKRKEIRKAFQCLPNRAKRQTHLKELIELRQTMFKGKALEVHRKRKPRTFSASYFLKSPADHKRVHVCLKAFLQILVSP
jgi:hypothetical protein